MGPLSAFLAMRQREDENPQLPPMPPNSTALRGGFYQAPVGPAPPNLPFRPQGQQAGPAPPVASPESDRAYQAWRATLPKRLQYEGDYDLRGFYNKYPEFRVNKPGQHMTDEFKLPNHPTFSDQSRYADPRHPGGHWNKGDVYVPAPPASHGFDAELEASRPRGILAQLYGGR